MYILHVFVLYLFRDAFKKKIAEKETLVHSHLTPSLPSLNTVKPFASKFLHMDEILKDWSMKGLTTHHIITLEPMGRF